MFDVAVIGGGVVGCAVARRFALDGARVVLLERGLDILSGASRANSALLHTGFDAPPGSLELACMQEGYSEYLRIRERLNLPLLETGALVVAWSDADLARLQAVEEKARANGVLDVERLEPSAVLSREPHLAPHLRGALLVPGEHVIDPWSAPLAYLMQAVLNGASVRFGAEITGGGFSGQGWSLHFGAETVCAGTVINCAGLFGDRLEELLLGETDFTIKPRKGQFVVFDKPAAALLRSIILPVPDERTKGIVLAPTIFGNVLVGPTAEEQDDRERAAVDRDTLEALRARAVELVPALEAVSVNAVYAGLRPASERKEYRIRTDPARRWIRVGGIRSTGLTAALGLARHVRRLYDSWGNGQSFRPPEEPVWPRVPNLAEHLDRGWRRGGGGGIVCHCEMVTAREIEDALSGPLPARDLAGLKRRTRACMGRCQGFYCQARIAALTAGRLTVPLAESSDA